MGFDTKLTRVAYSCLPNGKRCLAEHKAGQAAPTRLLEPPPRPASPWLSWLARVAQAQFPHAHAQEGEDSKSMPLSYK